MEASFVSNDFVFTNGLIGVQYTIAGGYSIAEGKYIKEN
jgi:hypothetical protein